MITRHSLNGLCHNAYHLLNGVGLLPDGRELIALFGRGDEMDNLAALFHWMDHLEGRTEVEAGTIKALFLLKLRSSVNRMAGNALPPRRVIDDLPLTHASSGERENLAHASVFLVSCHLSEVDAQQGTDYSARWDVEHAVAHCVQRLQAFDLRYQFGAADLLPRLSNHYFRRCVTPWMQRSITAIH